MSASCCCACHRVGPKRGGFLVRCTQADGVVLWWYWKSVSHDGFEPGEGGRKNATPCTKAQGKDIAKRYADHFGLVGAKYDFVKAALRDRGSP